MVIRLVSGMAVSIDMIAPDRKGGLEKSHSSTQDDNCIARGVPIRNSQSPSARIPKESLGLIKALPPELLNQILYQLDLPSLFAFRRVNRCALLAVDGLHSLGVLREHCPDVLGAFLSVRTRLFDLTHLYETVKTSQCSKCTEFGNYLCLITCRRICYSCFNRRLEFLPASVTHVTNISTVVPQQERRLKTQPSTIGPPGTRVAFAKPWAQKLRLLDRGTAVELCEDYSSYVLSPRGAETRRRMAIISAPTINTSEMLADWGTPCFICSEARRSWGDAARPKTKYTREGLANHVKTHQKGPREAGEMSRTKGRALQSGPRSRENQL
ncbi:hypothetical protein BGZ63DRAFT_401163 [Mariannaea sp. PMI_226]|nr:hypothetical protein BGZ63DRAFT_401163 [Mariannaea sp. PMI_226]